MADYADLQSRIEAVIVAGGLVVAPSGSDPEDIPAHGAGSWVAVELVPGAGVTASNGYAREEHECTLAMVAALTADRNASRRTALDHALTLRSLLDTPDALSSVSAHAVCDRYEITEVGSTFVASASFAIQATTTI